MSYFSKQNGQTTNIITLKPTLELAVAPLPSIKGTLLTSFDTIETDGTDYINCLANVSPIMTSTPLVKDPEKNKKNNKE